MKNLKIYKKAIALLTASSILLLSGCTISKNNNKESVSNSARVDKYCDHLTVYFAEGPVTFKECEGYEISAISNRGTFKYSVKKDGEYIISSGFASNYTVTVVDHSIEDEHLDLDSLQKAK